MCYINKLDLLQIFGTLIFHLLDLGMMLAIKSSVTDTGRQTYYGFYKNEVTNHSTNDKNQWINFRCLKWSRGLPRMQMHSFLPGQQSISSKPTLLRSRPHFQFLLMVRFQWIHSRVARLQSLRFPWTTWHRSPHVDQICCIFNVHPFINMF